MCMSLRFDQVSSQPVTFSHLVDVQASPATLVQGIWKCLVCFAQDTGRWVYEAFPVFRLVEWQWSSILVPFRWGWEAVHKLVLLCHIHIECDERCFVLDTWQQVQVVQMVKGSSSMSRLELLLSLCWRVKGVAMQGPMFLYK